MVLHGLSSKRATKVHVNHTDAGTVNSWRYRLKKRIPRLKKARYTIIDMEKNEENSNRSTF